VVVVRAVVVVVVVVAVVDCAAEEERPACFPFCRMRESAGMKSLSPERRTAQSYLCDGRQCATEGNVRREATRSPSLVWRGSAARQFEDGAAVRPRHRREVHHLDGELDVDALLLRPRRRHHVHLHAAGSGARGGVDTEPGGGGPSASGRR